MGSMRDAVTQASRIETTGSKALSCYRLWIDGVLSDSQVESLTALSCFTSGRQHPGYYMAELSSYMDGTSLRKFLDPNLFVLQRDHASEMLELNFNPTHEQIAALRRLREYYRKVTLNCTNS